MTIITVGMGFMMLIAGRPVYTVFVGGAGYLIGMYLASRFDLAQSTWNGLVTPILFAVIGGLAAALMGRWAARAAGFIAGGYLVYSLPQLLGANPSWVSKAAFFIAGVICFILLIASFDAFLIFLSSVTAAAMILSSARLGSLNPVIMFLIVTVFGVIAQYLIFEYGKASPD